MPHTTCFSLGAYKPSLTSTVTVVAADIKSKLIQNTQKLQQNAFKSDKTRQDANFQGNSLLQATNITKTNNETNNFFCCRLSSSNYPGCVHEDLFKFFCLFVCQNADNQICFRIIIFLSKLTRIQTNTGTVSQAISGKLLRASLVSWCFEPSQPQRITSGLKPLRDGVKRI